VATTRKDTAYRFSRAGARRAAPAATATAETPYLVRYVSEGRIVEVPAGGTIDAALRFAESDPENMAIVVDPAPNQRRIEELRQALDLHDLLTEDLLHAGQRPKLERYGDVLFLVARAARYIDEDEEIELAEFHVLVHRNVIIVLCQDGTWIDGTPSDDLAQMGVSELSRRALVLGEDTLSNGPEAVLYRFLDAVVDGYGPVLRGIDIDREQIESQVFTGKSDVAQRIYRLSQEVIETQHAMGGLFEVIDALSRGFAKYDVGDQMQAYLQDVGDHLERARGHAGELREALAQILSVNATLVAQRQNEDMKKISGWAAILFAPTLIAAVYGMNFDVMPELHWAYGYPLAVGSMIAFAALLWLLFKWRRWM